MRSHIFRLLIIFVIALVQATLLEKVKILEATPDLVFILILYFGIKSGIAKGQTTGFTGGFIIDLYSTHFGLNMFVYTILGFLSGISHKKVYIDTFLATFIYLLIATIIKGILYFSVTHLIINELTLSEASSYITNTLLIEMFLNAITAPFIFSFLNKFDLT